MASSLSAISPPPPPEALPQDGGGGLVSIPPTNSHGSSSSSSASPNPSSSSSLQSTVASTLAAAETSFWWFLPGAAQGATTVLLGHPFDTAKTRLQADTQLRLQTRSSVRVMRQMVRAEGALSLYRGVTPPLAIMGSKRGLQFALWEQIKKRKGSGGSEEQQRPTSASASALSASPHLSSSSYITSEDGSQSVSTSAAAAVRRSFSAAGVVVANNNFLSGAVSGACGTILGCPMHVIKIQTQNRIATLATPSTSSGANAGANMSSNPQRWNAFYCTRAILREDGVGGLYRGFRFHVLKDTVFAGTYLGTYELLRGELAAASAAVAKVEAEGGTAVQHHGGGTIAGLFVRAQLAWAATFAASANGAAATAYSATEMLTTSAPSAAATAAMAVEDANAAIRNRDTTTTTSATSKSSSTSSSSQQPSASGAGASNEARGGAVAVARPPPPSTLAVFTAGVLASCLTWVVLYPLDTLKTAVQARNAVNFQSFMQMMAANPLAVYRGFSAALVRAGPVSGAAMVAYESMKSFAAGRQQQQGQGGRKKALR